MNTIIQNLGPVAIAQSASPPVVQFRVPFRPGRYEAPKRLAAVSSLKPTEQPSARYSLLGASEFHSLAPTAWAVKGLFPQKGLGLVYGASGAGKSFLVLDLACAISEGRPWFGQRTTQSPVIYLCLEGAAGFTNRTKAWEAANQRLLPAMLRLVIEPFSLLDGENVQRLLRTIADWTKTLPAGMGPPVIVVDTLNRAMPGADESGSSDMGSILNACALMSHKTGGLTILVHHVGKDADRGPRGHSSLISAVDAAILVCRSGKGRFWEGKKVKDGEDGIRGDFELESAVLGVDGDGDEVSSCVLRSGDCSHGAGVRSELSPSLQTALVSLVDVLGGPNVSAIQDENPIVALADWRAALYKNCSAPSASGKRNAFSRALSELRDLGYLSVTDDGLGLNVSGAELARILPELRKG